MAITKKQLRQLSLIQQSLARGVKHLLSPRTAYCLRDTVATTTLHYTRADGSSLLEMERQIGTELCYIYNALDSLESFINSANPATKTQRTIPCDSSST